MKQVGVVMIALMVTFVIMITGCSPNQWATKEIMDGSSMKHGEEITVQQKDGNNISGTFVGTATMPLDQYKEYYSSTAQINGAEGILPKLGERVELSTSLASDKVFQGQLIGFNSQSLFVKLDGESETNEIYIPSLVTLASRSGKSVERMEFRKMFLSGAVPLMTSLVLRNSTGDVQVPVTSIKELKVSNGSGTNSVTMSAEQFLASRLSAR